MTVGPDNTTFQFYFSDGSSTLAQYHFVSWIANAIPTSNPDQDLIDDDVDIPTSLDQIPDRASDAQLMTFDDSPVTWPVQTHKVRVTLQGVQQWIWSVTFEVEMVTFQLSGTWTRF
jgi:hypothetical protein